MLFLFQFSLLSFTVFGQENHIEPDISPDIIAREIMDTPFNLSETSSMVLLTEKDFNQGSVVNLWQLIQGRAPGMIVSVGNVPPGASAMGFMRDGVNLPLVVVDGLIIDMKFSEGMRDPLNFLNPAYIEYILLISDAASSTQYGLRGGNGVIMIRTKRAQKNTPLSVHYSSNLSIVQPDRPNHMLLGNRELTQNSVTGESEEAYSSLKSEMPNPAFSHSHNISASGNAATTPWRASVHYQDHEAVLNSVHLNRYGVRLNFQPSLLDDHLQILVNLHASQQENRNEKNGYFYPLQDSIYRLKGLSNTQSLNLQASADYTLHFFPAITIGVAAYRQSMLSKRDKTYTGMTNIYPNSFWEDEFTNNRLDARIGYLKTWADSQSSFGLNATWSMENLKEDWLSKTTSEPITYFGANKTDSNFTSFTVGAGYTIKNIYHLSYTFRNDHSSIYEYNPDKSRFNYHSLGAAWDMHNEDFWPERFFLSKLKIRAAIGQSGISAEDPYSNHYIELTPLPTPFKKESFDAGFDFGIYTNRFTGSFTFFNTNQNVSRTSDSWIINHNGLEFTLNSSIMKKEIISWDVGIHFAAIKTQLLRPDFHNDPSLIYGGIININNPINDTVTNGHPLWGWRRTDLDSIDSFNRPIVFSQLVSHLPDFYMSISSNMRYQNWRFSFAGSLSRLKILDPEYANSLRPYLYTKDVPFFSMDFLSLGYRFNLKKLKPELSFVMQNPFAISEYSGSDPHVFRNIGTDFNSRPQIYTLGLKIGI